MKKLSLVLMCLLLIGLAGSALAKQPKTFVAHCGCTYDGSELTWSYNEVSAKSKGHQQHDATDIEVCWNNELEVEGDTLERGFNDCILLDGTLLSGVEDCLVDPIEDDNCEPVDP